jgi:hypothetical protein
MNVFPNPWFGGRGPRCVVQCDPDHRSPREFVGAALDPEICVVKRPAQPGVDRVQGVGYLYRGIKASEVTPETLVAAGPVEIPRTPYYCQQIRHHALVPADPETAKAGRVRWEEPVVVLRHAAGQPEPQPVKARRQPAGGDSA